MKKITPDPPVTDLPHPDLEAQRLKQAADRALDFYLCPGLKQDPGAARKPSTIFIVDPAVDNETLLGIQQVIMLGELAVNRVLDNLVPPA